MSGKVMNHDLVCKSFDAERYIKVASPDQVVSPELFICTHAHKNFLSYNDA